MLEMAITFIGMIPIALILCLLFVNLFDGLLKTGDKNGLYDNYFTAYVVLPFFQRQKILNITIKYRGTPPISHKISLVLGSKLHVPSTKKTQMKLFVFRKYVLKISVILLYCTFLGGFCTWKHPHKKT